MHRRVWLTGGALCLAAMALTSLRAEPTGTVSGRAVMDDGRTPWPGAKVGLFPVAGPDDEDHETPVREAQADRQGRFTFDKVPAGPWWVVARSATEPAVIRFVEAEAGGPPVTVARGRATLRGQVLWSEGGEPVPLARVDLSVRWPDEVASPDGGCWACDRTTLVTGRDGRFELAGLAPGCYWLHARNQGAEEQEVGPPRGERNDRAFEVVVPDDQQMAAQTVVLKPWVVSGTVLGVDGQPAADVTVALVRPEDSQLPATPAGFHNQRLTHSDAAGRFCIPRIGSGSYWLWARTAGANRLTRIFVGEEQQAPVTLPLLASAIDGHVVDADGRPRAGVEVMCNGTPLERRRGPDELPYPQTVRDTDADGRFSVPGLPPGRYRLVVRSHGPRVTTTERLAPATTATTTTSGAQLLEQEVEVGAGAATPVRLALLASGIKGQVVRPDGQPLSGAVVSYGRGRQVTGDDGRFEFASVEPGERWLTVTKDQIERRQQVTVAERGVAEVRLALPAFVPKVVFTLQRPDGRPASSRRVHGLVQLANSWGDFELLNTATDAAGQVQVSLPHAEAGGGELRALFFDPLLGCVGPVTMRYGEQLLTTISLRLEPGGAIEGVVTDADGQPLGGVTISPRLETEDKGVRALWETLYHYAWSGQDAAYPATVSRTGDGQYRLGPLPPGRYTFEGVDSPVTVRAGETVTVKPVATPLPRTTQVSGRVVSGGRPLASREVALWFYRGGSVMSPSPVARRVVTDAEGRFTVVVPVSEECSVSAWPTLHPRQADLAKGQRAQVVTGQPVTLAENLEIGQD